MRFLCLQYEMITQPIIIGHTVWVYVQNRSETVEHFARVCLSFPLEKKGIIINAVVVAFAAAVAVVGAESTHGIHNITFDDCHDGDGIYNVTVDVNSCLEFLFSLSSSLSGFPNNRMVLRVHIWIIWSDFKIFLPLCV